MIKRNRLLEFLEVSVLVKSVGDEQFNLTFKKISRCDIKMKAIQRKVSAYQIDLRPHEGHVRYVFFLTELQTFSFRSSTEVSRRGLKTSSTLPNAS